MISSGIRFVRIRMCRGVFGGEGVVGRYQKFREKMKINEDVSLEIYGF